MRPRAVAACAVLVPLVALAAAACGSPSASAPPAAVSAFSSIADPATAPATIASATTAPTSTSPPSTDAPTTAPVVAAGCPAEPGHAAVVDRARQRAWLCDGPQPAGDELLATTAVSQPKPGTYEVYAKVARTTSTFGGHLSYLDRFVAFTHGLRTDARIAFHAVPHDAKGKPFQDLATVGELGQKGESSGCIRLLPDDAVKMWDWLSLGDPVVVIS